MEALLINYDLLVIIPEICQKENKLIDDLENEDELLSEYQKINISEIDYEKIVEGNIFMFHIL